MSDINPKKVLRFVVSTEIASLVSCGSSRSGAVSVAATDAPDAVSVMTAAPVAVLVL